MVFQVYILPYMLWTVESLALTGDSLALTENSFILTEGREGLQGGLGGSAKTRPGKGWIF